VGGGTLLAIGGHHDDAAQGIQGLHQRMEAWGIEPIVIRDKDQWAGAQFGLRASERE
jgi:hypothetical protein